MPFGISSNLVMDCFILKVAKMINAIIIHLGIAQSEGLLFITNFLDICSIKKTS
jgi:hypothetical protein